MSNKTLPEMTGDLAGLMHSQLGLRKGKTLEDKLSRGERLLPRRLRREARILVDGAARSTHPKMRKQLDLPRMERAYADLHAHLSAIDPVKRRVDRLLGILAGIAFNFLLIAAGVIVWMVWTGRL